MTLLNKTPMARKAAWSYCRRCLAVMLCCVLVFGLTVRTAPRAKAVDASAAIVAGSWAADSVAATIGFDSIVGSAGLVWAFAGDFNDRVDVMMNRGYDFGYALDGAIKAGELSDAAVTWMNNTVAVFKEKGGLLPGDSFTIPADVAEEIRTWTLCQLSFVDGQLMYDDRVTTVGFMLSSADFTELDAYTSNKNKLFFLPAHSIGSLVRWPVFDYSSDYNSSVDVGNGLSFLFDYSLKSSRWGCNYGISVSSSNKSVIVGGGSLSAFSSFVSMCQRLDDSLLSARYSIVYNPATSRVYPCVYLAELDGFDVYSQGYFELSDVLPSVTTTIKETAATSKPITKDLTVTVPADLPVTDVGGYDIPIFGDITGEELTGEKAGEDTPAKNPGITAGEISQAITDALPITGAAVGDQVVEEAMAEPDSLGAVFISKFPFSIPWDIYKAIKLLAAPPVTPYWEVDFMQPIADRVGGFRGSTTIVIDFGEYPIVGIATRWTSTLLFVYALAMGTKKLIWTA